MARAARQHVRQHGLDPVHDTEIVERHRCRVRVAEKRFATLGLRLTIVIDRSSSVEDREVDAAPRPLDLPCRDDHGRAIGDVARHGQDRGGAAGRISRRDGLEPAAAPRRDRDLRPFANERSDERFANPGARARQPHSRVRQLHMCVPIGRMAENEGEAARAPHVRLPAL